MPVRVGTTCTGVPSSPHLPAWTWDHGARSEPMDLRCGPFTPQEGLIPHTSRSCPIRRRSLPLQADCTCTRERARTHTHTHTQIHTCFGKGTGPHSSWQSKCHGRCCRLCSASGQRPGDAAQLVGQPQQEGPWHWQDKRGRGPKQGWGGSGQSSRHRRELSRDELWSQENTRSDLSCMFLSERSQSEKATRCVIARLWH